jgi:hypothetical protein
MTSVRAGGLETVNRSNKNRKAQGARGIRTEGFEASDS